MITLIHTRCSRSTQIIDGTLTALGWTGFLYLGLSDAFANTAIPAFTEQHHALLWFTEILSISFLLLIAWSLYNKSRYCPRHTASAKSLNTTTLSTKFQMPVGEIDNLQDSQICVIHHRKDGSITRFQTHHMPINITSAPLRLVSRA